jgi:hypothetical protein
MVDSKCLSVTKVEASVAITGTRDYELPCDWNGLD